tara:strand:- start:159 stop:479 length:321 start_codon:yes stop_codon:yes gene_type:complete
MEHLSTSQVLVVVLVVLLLMVILVTVVGRVTVFNFLHGRLVDICQLQIHIGLVYQVYLEVTLVVAVVVEIIVHTHLKECLQMLPMVAVVLEDPLQVLVMELLVKMD